MTTFILTFTINQYYNKIKLKLNYRDGTGRDILEEIRTPSDIIDCTDNPLEFMTERAIHQTKSSRVFTFCKYKPDYIPSVQEQMISNIIINNYNAHNIINSIQLREDLRVYKKIVAIMSTARNSLVVLLLTILAHKHFSS